MSRNLSPTTDDLRACFFDLLAPGSEDLRPLRLTDRKRQLRELLRGADQRLVYVDHVEERGEELLAGARALGMEGIVAKRSDSPYITGRTGVWRKVKVEETGALRGVKPAGSPACGVRPLPARQGVARVCRARLIPNGLPSLVAQGVDGLDELRGLDLALLEGHDGSSVFKVRVD